MIGVGVFCPALLGTFNGVFGEVGVWGPAAADMMNSENCNNAIKTCRVGLGYISESLQQLYHLSRVV